MTPTSRADAVDDAGDLLDLLEFGMEIQRENYRSENPSATERDLDEMICAWLLDCPLPDFGPVHWIERQGTSAASRAD